MLRGFAPRDIGRYRAVAHLATGGMAEVLLAKLIGPGGFEKPVVIKSMLPHLVRDRRYVEMFVDEARLHARTQHPNVVQVLELGPIAGVPFLVLEYLHGESVAGLLRRLRARGRHMDLALAAWISAEVCAGLHAAHETTDDSGRLLSMVHRDVSPSNVFLTYDGHVKLLDFGVAKANNRRAVTQAGGVKGTFAYMAPEQCLGRPVDRRADIFSAGVVLFEISTGHRLFDAGNEAQIVRAICDEPIPTAERVVPDFPQDLGRVMRRALAREPSARYPNALEMRKALLASARSLGLGDGPDESLRTLMHNLFADRIEQKNEVLRALTDERAPLVIPGDPDLDVVLPSIVRHPSAIPTPRSRTRVGKLLLLLGLFAIAPLVAGVIFFGRWQAAPSRPLAREAKPKGESRVETPHLVSQLHIETDPTGATVHIDGLRRGVTPLILSVPRGEQALRVELRQPGYDTEVTSVTPNAERQSLQIRLRQRPRRAISAEPRRSTGAPPVIQQRANPESGFRRFE